ncbi:cytochrome C biogenesis protein [Longibacter salinarum]|uniref:Cytochrome C biogenesis protein n=1 Tax=Longibacter salinarum TaxID=1850348 RepID=A0A2A8CZT8_9BACT|nr:TlpA disulfide reductase family protein [Longibacter salinarum]PEN14166.1 cytochrome C biogenesis protein [Longibacter salinarum]
MSTDSSSAGSSTGTAQSSLLRRVGRFVWDYWHWPVLLGAAVYLYLQLMPPIDLSEPSSPAPSVTAQTLDGDTFRLSDYRGDIVVVNVWATWCPPCRVEMPGFVDLQAEMKEQDVQFIGISVDRTGDDLVRDFVTEYEINFPTIHDPRVAARHFPGNTVPRTYLIDREGQIRYEHTGLILKPALRDAIEDLLAE